MAKIVKNQNAEPQNMLKLQIRDPRFANFDFTQNLSDGKILIFPHCDPSTF